MSSHLCAALLYLVDTTTTIMQISIEHVCGYISTSDRQTKQIAKSDTLTIGAPKYNCNCNAKRTTPTTMRPTRDDDWCVCVWGQMCVCVWGRPRVVVGCGFGRIADITAVCFVCSPNNRLHASLNFIELSDQHTHS